MLWKVLQSFNELESLADSSRDYALVIHGNPHKSPSRKRFPNYHTGSFHVFLLHLIYESLIALLEPFVYRQSLKIPRNGGMSNE